jgi:hypothetical protein
MAELKKALKDDFEEVYPLIRKMNPNIEKETWKRIFFPKWAEKEDYCGYLLADNGKVVGFLGYIFCTREINGRTEKFCSLTTWDVDEKYRTQSLSLLYPFLSLEGYTLVNYTPSARVTDIFKKLGFKSLDNKYAILYPNPFAAVLNRKKATVIFDGCGFESLLGEKEKRIYSDHKPYDCIHLLIRSDIGNCYLVLSKFKKKRVPFLTIRYISNMDIFESRSSGVLIELLFRQKAAYIQVDERLLKGRKINNSISGRADIEKLYKSDSIERGDIDNLYSELILLGLI